MPAEWPAGQRVRIRSRVEVESNCLLFGTGGTSGEAFFTSMGFGFLEGGGTVSRREGSSLIMLSHDLW